MTVILRQKLRQRLQHWLAKKFTDNKNFQLNHGTLLVFPTRYGLWFVALIVLLYLLGTNYQNNLILLLGYLLLSVFILSIWFAWRNLAGLTIQASPPAAIYAGQQAQLPLTVQQPASYQAVQFAFATAKTKVSSGEQASLQWPTVKRGHYLIDSVLIQTEYPLGLIRCWSYLPLQLHYWVYPTPVAPNILSTGADTKADSSQQSAAELPDQLKAYQAGDSIRRLHWKRLARQPDSPVVKVSEQQPKADPRWLEVPPLHGAALEQCLSEVCYQLLELEAKQLSYGLRTPVGDLPLGQGQQHLQQCLQRLALC
ncbi:DUF58 domain-containing protein [Alkalimonas sp. MEB108]|uniref:DUF58 domain-containing protein n=1 Tax=Alkalimonas cellulosilytica TaxID=3058395 RepID=A0ABU7J227_9GAMM|nr:DUF58 domain-containing protein [Alkalimonas sp. MEB108]MEE2000568.1 DUF58 domain-containing protein [Alkalimonas sp. MEB108]